MCAAIPFSLLSPDAPAELCQTQNKGEIMTGQPKGHRRWEKGGTSSDLGQLLLLAVFAALLVILAFVLNAAVRETVRFFRDSLPW